jgi:hypothetical protein
LLNYLNKSRKKCFSKLGFFIYLFTHSSIQSLPKQKNHTYPTLPPGQTSSPFPPLSGLHIVGWFLFVNIEWQLSKAKSYFIFLILLLFRVLSQMKRQHPTMVSVLAACYQNYPPIAASDYQLIVASEEKWWPPKAHLSFMMPLISCPPPKKVSQGQRVQYQWLTPCAD